MLPKKKKEMGSRKAATSRPTPLVNTAAKDMKS